MLSTNQLRHHGVDVCDVHPKFASGGRKGLFRIKVDDHILPFKIENGLATLNFRKPTDEELDSCDDVLELDSCDDVLELTSDAQWDPEYLMGNNFTPGSDHHFYDVSGYIVNNVTTVVDNDNFYDCQETEDVNVFHNAPATEPLTDPPTVTLRGIDPDVSDSLTAGPTDTNEMSSAPIDDATSPTLLDMVSDTSIPTLATPPSTLHVISTNGDYGPSQDRLYDNLDQ